MSSFGDTEPTVLPGSSMLLLMNGGVSVCYSPYPSPAWRARMERTVANTRMICDVFLTVRKYEIDPVPMSVKRGKVRGLQFSRRC